MIGSNVKKYLDALPPHVTLLAATKTRSVDEIREAIDAGIRVIGENYVQEAYRKKPALDRDVEWHLIGHLQKNKVKRACEIFDIIETVDSEELALALNRRCEALDKVMPVMIEVNSGKEPQKNGVFPEAVESLAEKISELEHLELVGLMTMGPARVRDLRPYFRTVAQLFEALKHDYSLRYLSMGMTDSWRVAVEEGANIVRIGSGIFGPRKTKK